MTRRLSVLPVVLLLAVACANPVPPTGGPVDREPPYLVATVPDSNAVGVTDETVRLTFSEAVDQATLARALSVVPEPVRPPTIRWRGRTAEISLGALRDTTTYVLTIDNTFRDARGVALAQPLVIAFATGPTLDAGQLSGRVLDAAEGAGVAGIDVYAYPAGDTLLSRPLYRTQTGSDGRFTFRYLGEAPLFVAAVRDANRNRRADPGEAAAPPPLPSLRPDSLAVESPWLLARPDTTPPVVERLRSYSATRHALRLREGLADAGGDWQLVDSTGAKILIQTRYRSAAAPREVFFVTPPLTPDRRYTLHFGTLTDSTGNVLSGGSETLAPSAAADTFELRFTGFVPASGRLRPGQPGGVRFSVPLPDSLQTGLVTALGPDSTGVAVPLETADGTTYTFPVADSTEITVHADRLGDVPETLLFVAPTARDLGGIEGVVVAPNATQVVIVLRTEDGFETRTQAGADGRFRFASLLPGTYALRAFLDQDGDGRWNAGALAPYRSPEPIRWAEEPLTVRPRWDHALSDTLRFE